MLTPSQLREWERQRKDPAASATGGLSVLSRMRSRRRLSPHADRREDSTLQPQQALAALLADAEQMQHAAVRSMEALRAVRSMCVQSRAVEQDHAGFQVEQRRRPASSQPRPTVLRTLQDARAAAFAGLRRRGHGILLGGYRPFRGAKGLRA